MGKNVSYWRRGQSLVEYLILVSLMGVATLGIVRLLGHSVAAKFTQVVNSIQGREQAVEIQQVDKRYYEQKDMSDFMRGSAKGQ